MPVFNPVILGSTGDATATPDDIAFGKTAYLAEGLVAGTGVVVTPDSAYIGITSENLNQVSDSQDDITFYSSLKDHSQELILLQDRVRHYFILPYPDAGVTQELLLMASDGTSGTVQVKRNTATQRLGFKKDAVVISCADRTQSVSSFLAAYGNGKVEPKTVQGNTVTVTVTKNYAHSLFYLDQENTVHSVDASGTLTLPKGTIFIERADIGSITSSYVRIKIGNGDPMILYFADSDGWFEIQNPTGGGTN